MEPKLYSLRRVGRFVLVVFGALLLLVVLGLLVGARWEDLGDLTDAGNLLGIAVFVGFMVGLYYGIYLPLYILLVRRTGRYLWYHPVYDRGGITLCPIRAEFEASGNFQRLPWVRSLLLVFVYWAIFLLVGMMLFVQVIRVLGFE